MPASDQQAAFTRERRKQNVALRLAGVDWETIAERLGYADRGAACKDFTRAIAASRAELTQSVDELRQVELARLDRMQAGLWTAAVGGNARAAETVLRIMAERRRYLPGVEAPTQHEVITIDQIDRELSELRAQFPDLAVPGAAVGEGPVREADPAAGPADG